MLIITSISFHDDLITRISFHDDLHFSGAKRICSGLQQEINLEIVRRIELDCSCEIGTEVHASLRIYLKGKITDQSPLHTYSVITNSNSNN